MVQPLGKRDPPPGYCNVPPPKEYHGQSRGVSHHHRVATMVARRGWFHCGALPRQCRGVAAPRLSGPRAASLGPGIGHPAPFGWSALPSNVLRTESQEVSQAISNVGFDLRVLFPRLGRGVQRLVFRPSSTSLIDPCVHSHPTSFSETAAAACPQPSLRCPSLRAPRRSPPPAPPAPPVAPARGGRQGADLPQPRPCINAWAGPAAHARGNYSCRAWLV